MTPLNDPIEGFALVGIPQIAEIANVGRSAVGNWRKRHPDFPVPKVQTPSGALFDLKEVEDWLIQQGKISQRAPAKARLWAIADATRGIWAPSEFANFGGAFLVYLEVCARADGETPPDLELPIPTIPDDFRWSKLRQLPTTQGFIHRLTQAARGIEDANPDLQGLLDPHLDQHQPSADAIAYRVATTLADAADTHTARRDLFDGLTHLVTTDRFSGAFSTPAELATLVARLVDFHGGVIFDPAVGEGRLLWQAAFDRPTPVDRAVSVFGIDVNVDACHRSRARFYLYGREAEIHTANALTADSDSLPQADAVVADPPYQLADWGDVDVYVDPRWSFGPPPPKSADFAWLQLVTQHLTPAGNAAVLMGAGSLSRGGREGAIRQRMVETGVVEAIVALPPRLRADTTIPLVLWLLRSPATADKRDHILLLDASGLAERGRSLFSLPEAAIEQISQIVATWRDTSQVATCNSKLATSVPVASILSADGDLTPARYRQRPGLDVNALEQRAQTLRQSLLSSTAAASAAYADLTTYLEGRR